MIIKFVTVPIFFLFSPLLYGQNKIVNESVLFTNSMSSHVKEVKSTTFYEVETMLPVFKSTLDTTQSLKADISYYSGKKSRKVSMGISYVGGHEALKKYQDSLYWANYNGDEINGSCLYTILFDKKLRIREIKIINRKGYNNSQFNYDKLVKKILLSTEGDWIKKDNSLSEKWYFTIGRFLIR